MNIYEKSKILIIEKLNFVVFLVFKENETEEEINFIFYDIYFIVAVIVSYVSSFAIRFLMNCGVEMSKNIKTEKILITKGVEKKGYQKSGTEGGTISIVIHNVIMILST